MELFVSPEFRMLNRDDVRLLEAITTLTLKRKIEMPFLPCLLCAAKLERRTDKNRKPYFVCNPCGIQLFIRKEHGIGLLDKLLRESEKNEIPFKQRATQVYQIQALLTEITEIKQQIERLESQTSLFFPDKDRVRACDLLKIKLSNLFRELEQISQQNAQIK